MNELGLFAGAGGGLLASRLLGWRTVCAVEIDAYCQRVLAQRQLDGHLDPFPIWDDVRTFDGKPWRGAVDVVSGGFPARTSPALDAAQVSPENDLDFGSRCSASLARFCLRSSLPKTPRGFALADLTSCSKGLPAWGLMRRGVCSELITSVRRTSEIECGSLLPTPTGAGNEGSPSMQKWPAHRALSALMLPTPIASDRNGDRQRGAGSIARGGGRRLTLDMLPTPTTRDWRSGAASEATHARNARPLNEVAHREGVTGGLFIALREWMMGWPLGWSASEPLATDRFRQWQRSHGMR